MKRSTVGSLAILGLTLCGGCHEPGEMIAVGPPGVANPRTPPPEKDEPQAIGEVAMQTPVDTTKKKAVTGTISPPTAIGETKTTPSGVKYETLKEGDGPEAKPGQSVTVHYTGSLDDGTIFDDSRARKEPSTFEIGTGQVIPGWDEAVPGMKVGEQRRLTIPPELGYGQQGSPPKIPGSSTLHFDIELVGVK